MIMKKILISICLIFWTVFSYSQLTPVPRGNANQIDAYRGINTGLVGTMLTPNDTTNSPATPYYGALTVLPSDAGKDTIPIWMSNGVKWIRFSGGNATTINDTIYTRAPIAVDRVTLPGHQIIYLLHLDGIVSPGYVVWTGFGLDFNVTPAEFYINYRQFFSPFGLVTLATAPVSDSRVDLFFVDTTAQASALTGMASATPVTPQTNPSSQLPLTTVTVNAGDTVPSGIALETIYNQHIAPPTEWIPTISGSIATDFDNTANPYIGTKAIFVSTYANGSQIIFTKGSGTDTVKPGQIIRGFVSFNIPFTSQFQFQWFNGATAVSNSIAVNSGYGINPNNVNNYQIFAIPLNAWNFTPASNGIFNKLVITMGGADTSGAGGFYMDYLQLQTGLLNPTNADYLDSVYMRNDSLFQYKHGIEYFRGKTTGGGAGGALANFYLKDSSLSSDRNVDGATHDLSISNVDVFQLGANTSFGINAPSITLAGTTNSFQGSTWDWNDGGSNHYLQLSSTALTINQAWSLPFVDGTANQVLTTNGSGIASWQDASGAVTADNGLNISSGSNVQWGGTLIQTVEITENLHPIVIHGGNFSIDNYFVIDSASQNYRMGDLLGTGNGTYMHVDDANSAITFNGFSEPFLTSGWRQKLALPQYRSGGTGTPGLIPFVVTDTSKYKPVVIDTLTGEISQSHWYGSGGAGGGNTIYTADDSTTGDRIVYIKDDHSLTFADLNLGEMLSMYPEEGASYLRARNNTNDGNTGLFSLTVLDVSTTAQIIADFNDNTKKSTITVFADVSGSSTVFTADTHTFNGIVNIIGSFSLPYIAVTSTYTITSLDYTVNCPSGTFTVTLPTAVGISGRIYVVKNSGIGLITLDGDGSETIDGSATQPISAGNSLTVQSTNAGWIIL